MSGKTAPSVPAAPPEVSPPPIDVSPPARTARGEDHRQLCRALLDSSSDAVFLIDHATMTFKEVSPSASTLFGYSREQFIAAGPSLLSVAADDATFGAELEAASKGRPTPRRVAICQHRSGRRFLVEQSFRLVPNGNGPLILLRMQPLAAATRRPDGSALAADESVPCDPLTGLPGREAFERRLAEALDAARRDPSYSFAVFFVDLDGFKAVNDNLGHLAGDRILCEIAVRLAGCVRPDDMVARRGGDEFTLLIGNLRDPDDAVRVAGRICNEVVAHAGQGPQCWSVTTSIGIAIGHPGYGQADELIHDADMAMYRAKALGKARFVLHRPTPR